MSTIADLKKFAKTSQPKEFYLSSTADDGTKRGAYKQEDGLVRYCDWGPSATGTSVWLNSSGDLLFIGDGTSFKTDSAMLERLFIYKIIDGSLGRLHSTDEEIVRCIHDDLENYYYYMYNHFGWEGLGSLGCEKNHKDWCNAVLHHNFYCIEEAMLCPITDKEANVNRDACPEIDMGADGDVVMQDCCVEVDDDHDDVVMQDHSYADDSDADDSHADDSDADDSHADDFDADDFDADDSDADDKEFVNKMMNDITRMIHEILSYSRIHAKNIY